ncbi:hypothetical protein CKO44_04570 [Rubrivivax gelatinosus]|uniref:Uncharacterized protein n=1 Tax=Rubrivivax gelatinosus TaxID=28068 RepID=A0ABS1DPI1_RUBGE|nr:biofilm regulation protein kinase SiaB [Rubrivivax gelatinosus]MBK1612741.1 hypothetical protein [Rubrivivax gelatinosus]MBK1711475.1 hypothetical protein [Rubrivivax gelatinosus]
MDTIDLFGLREHFNRGRILLCFNGPISRSLIEEIGNALKNYLQADHAHPSSAMDVFGVYIELTQNIRHYAVSRNYGELDGAATVVVARDDSGSYIVQAGNLVEQDDGRALLERVRELAGLDKAQLKAAYKEQLRRPRSGDAASGAGLGLIDVARKSAAPLLADLRPAGDGRAFFSLRAVI